MRIMKKSKILGITIVVVIFLVVISVIVQYKNTNKGGSGSGMFEKNSDKISIYIDGELTKELIGKENDKVIEKLKAYKWTDNSIEDTNKAIDDSFNIVFDFNNDWCKIYLHTDDTRCFVNNNEYEISKDLQKYLLNIINN